MLSMFDVQGNYYKDDFSHDIFDYLGFLMSFYSLSSIDIKRLNNCSYYDGSVIMFPAWLWLLISKWTLYAVDRCVHLIKDIQKVVVFLRCVM